MAIVERNGDGHGNEHYLDLIRQSLNRAFDSGDKALYSSLVYQMLGISYQQDELISDLSAEVEKLRLIEGGKELIFHFTYNGQDYTYDDTWGELVCDGDLVFLLQNQRCCSVQ